MYIARPSKLRGIVRVALRLPLKPLQTANKSLREQTLYIWWWDPSPEERSLKLP